RRSSDLPSFPTRRSSDLGAGGPNDEIAKLKMIFGARLEERIVLTFLFFGPPLGEVVQRDGIARDTVRALQRFGMTVIRDWRSREDRKSTRLNSSHQIISY